MYERGLLYWLISVTILSQCNSQSSLQCPIEALVNVSTTNQSVLLFSDFPTDNLNLSDVSYNPGALGPWYDIGSGIINVVQPGSVTRDVIVPILGANGNLTDLANSSPSIGNIAQDLARWWAGLIALTLFGGLLSCCFCVCCCSFGICRLCGKCGGDLKQEETNSMNCLTIVFTIILIVVTCGLIAGIIMAFFSNQQVYNSVQEFESTIDRSFSRAENFVNDSLLQVDTLLCQLNDTLDIVVSQARGLINEANSVIEGFSGNIYDIVDTTVSLSSALETVQSSLSSIGTTVTVLQSNASNLNSSLQNIAQQINNLNASCMGMCGSIDSTVFSNGLATNYQQLPNVTAELENVQSILSGINLTRLAEQGNATYNNAVDNVRSLTSTADTEIILAVNRLRTTVLSNSDFIRNFANQVTGPSGYISQGETYIDIGSQYIRTYDTPRFAVGIVLSCSAVVVVVVVFLGLICGLCGFRTDRAPYERTDLSNCGGITLLCAAVLGFIFGFLLLLLAALAFFGGGVIQKFCQDIEGPQYIAFNETIDNPSLFGGRYILSQFILQNGSIPLTVSGILVSCSQGNTVYDALKLNQSSYFQLIQNFTNISQFVPDVTGDINTIAQNISSLISPQTFVPQQVQDSLNQFTSTGVDGINITQFRDEISRALLSFNVTQQIGELTVLRDTLTNASRFDLANQTQGIIDNLEQLNNDVDGVGNQVNVLSNEVEQLDNNTQQLRDGVDDLLTNINTTFNTIIETGINPLVEEVQEVFPRAVGYGQQLIDHAFNSLENDVGNCFPLFATYTEFYNAICEFTLDGLNGFWLSLGMCGLFLIPIIIFAIVTSQYYRRMKYDDDVPFGEDSFPLKTF